MNSIDDELQQNAIKVMIRTYGQMPKQLFTSRHPSSTESEIESPLIRDADWSIQIFS